MLTNKMYFNFMDLIVYDHSIASTIKSIKFTYFGLSDQKIYRYTNTFPTIQMLLNMDKVK